jgi:DNA-binding transcriptional LysR family regulator
MDRLVGKHGRARPDHRTRRFATAARHFGISPEMAGNQVRPPETRICARLLNRST